MIVDDDLVEQELDAIHGDAYLWQLGGEGLRPVDAMAEIQAHVKFVRKRYATLRARVDLLEEVVEKARDENDEVLAFIKRNADLPTFRHPIDVTSRRLRDALDYRGTQ